VPVCRTSYTVPTRRFWSAGPQLRERFYELSPSTKRSSRLPAVGGTGEPAFSAGSQRRDRGATPTSSRPPSARKPPLSSSETTRSLVHPLHPNRKLPLLDKVIHALPATRPQAIVVYEDNSVRRHTEMFIRTTWCDFITMLFSFQESFIVCLILHTFLQPTHSLTLSRYSPLVFHTILRPFRSVAIKQNV
jgi:hypothetical protein